MPLRAGDTDLGPNPKLNNLYKPFNRAKYDLLYVLDSGILLASPQHLARSVDAFLLSPSFEQQGRRPVSLVHHVPFAVIPPPGNRGLGSWLERAFLNTNHAKMYLAINRSVLPPTPSSKSGLTEVTSHSAPTRTEIDSCVMGKSNFYRRSDVQNLTPGRTPPSECNGLRSLTCSTNRANSARPLPPSRQKLRRPHRRSSQAYHPSRPTSQRTTCSPSR